LPSPYNTYSSRIVLYTNKNQCGESTWAAFKNNSHCVNPYLTWASSANTRATCVKAWSGYGCTGDSIELNPTLHLEDLSMFSRGSSTWDKSIVSLSSCDYYNKHDSVSGCEDIHKICEEVAEYRYEQYNHRIFFTEDEKEVVSNEQDCGDAPTCSVTLTRSVTKPDSYTITKTHGGNISANNKFFAALSATLGYSGNVSWATSGSSVTMSSQSYMCEDSRGTILRVVFIPQIQLSIGRVYKKYPSVCTDNGYKENGWANVLVNSFTKFNETLYGRFRCELVGFGSSSQPSSSRSPLTP
jgi:hypothetical protein